MTAVILISDLTENSFFWSSRMASADRSGIFLNPSDIWKDVYSILLTQAIWNFLSNVFQRGKKYKKITYSNFIYNFPIKYQYQSKQTKFQVLVTMNFDQRSSDQTQMSVSLSGCF